ncbi:RNA methyltransferase [Gilvimarinus sp. SDUM040013]|uniref:RNA methyltransferase n=1 Tax=Gilvimarinus gilvus TaxID=3058038 RepID=A0ABU4RZN9_9GAMM|nr:RNA methyltransferase [Gilvimarinus sp. SDUM040013]MDO3386426.1 RNA methyltransferase [Gilvimarinus sp. SDUM040013]MDX6849692.1 RNA methyltransferase [Gilvimarinus sp. SDUM040013]
MNQGDSDHYLARKRFFSRMLTVYGRKPVLEALENKDIQVHRLHLASSNKPGDLVRKISELATSKGAEILHHDKQALSRISRNAKQDQGVAADLLCPGFQTLDQLVEQIKSNALNRDFRILALDGITNPQNLGMIIRSACAGNIDAILLPSKGCAQIDPLTIKASVGTVFRAPIVRLDGQLADALRALKDSKCAIIGLSSRAQNTLNECPSGNNVFVLGNETHGVSDTTQATCSDWVKIPMNNGVESLNVAVTAALIAFH